MKDMMTPAGFEDYKASADYIESIAGRADTAVILGSGLDAFAKAAEDAKIIPYREIPGFPVSTVWYQKGELSCGKIAGHNTYIMNGRFHWYEGWEMWQAAYPVGVFKLLGVKNLIVTNAAGGISPTYRPGDLVLVRDQIKLAPDTPCRGRNVEELGPRFFDMQQVFSSRLASLALEAAKNVDVMLIDNGVYGYMSGPQYETPAEIRMLGLLGATLVGMSTVAEVIQAAHCGIEALVISCVTNMAAGVSGAVPDDAEVLRTGAKAASGLGEIIKGVIASL